MYAIIENGGKQYRVSPGDLVTVERLSREAGEDVAIDTVLMVNRDDKSIYGSPYIPGAKVIATVEKNDRARKVMVHKQRPRKVYRKTNGHRQPYTALKIREIVLEDSNGT
ncbi:MAG: 50S ribosomal protein L21 [Nitrospira bacterium SM23_35]|jgi:large subunit ribosomal protein L21|nr:MAG: 50S ribosomal protein L21 [Nitrospira bacterium SM23_35]